MPLHAGAAAERWWAQREEETRREEEKEGEERKEAAVDITIISHRSASESLILRYEYGTDLVMIIQYKYEVPS